LIHLGYTSEKRPLSGELMEGIRDSIEEVTSNHGPTMVPYFVFSFVPATQAANGTLRGRGWDKDTSRDARIGPKHTVC